jgi:hypothetical protein
MELVNLACESLSVERSRKHTLFYTISKDTILIRNRVLKIAD